MALFRSRSAKPETYQDIITQSAPASPRPGIAVAEKPPAIENGITAVDGYVPPPEFREVRAEVQQHLVNEVSSISELGGAAKARQIIEPVFNQALTKANLVVSRAERARMLDMVLADILGFGPIQPLLDRDDITEVMVNGPSQVYIEQDGKLTLTDVGLSSSVCK